MAESIDPIYTAKFPFLRLEDNIAVFGKKDDDDSAMTWGPDQDGRDVEMPEYKCDKKYWELLGKPDEIIIAMTTESAWEDFQKPWRGISRGWGCNFESRPDPQNPETSVAWCITHDCVHEVVSG